VSRRPALTLSLLLAAGSFLPAAAQTPRWIAFGDSITQGFGDPSANPGYPPRLQAILAGRGVNVEVINAGLGGETTSEALSRVNGVLNLGGSRFLLMEGTNDVNSKVSTETIAANLDQIARRAEARSMEVVFGTIIPRLPSANTDGTNTATAELARAIRLLAAPPTRRLADPYEVFFYQTPSVFETYYLGGTDKLHPNTAGYNLLAGVFADALTGIDKVPPVVGSVTPPDQADRVPASTRIAVTLLDFGTGIDLANTRLLVNGQVVASTPEGDTRLAEMRYQSPTPLVGVVSVGLRSRDLASPANTVDREISRFTITGTRFLDGDVDLNGRVDGADLVSMSFRFGSRRLDPRYQLSNDVNGDGIIDGLDLAILAANFGKSSF
jgi:acyl-CoA thioesterase-1